MRSLLSWVLARHRHRQFVYCAIAAARASFWRLQGDGEVPIKKPSFVQLNPKLDVRVRGRLKRSRGYDYPELHEKDAVARSLMARKILEKQLQVQ